MAFAGIALMLWAEVAHSLRRRNHARSRLPARLSLSAHVVAGLVGPALILMHTHWQLRGLAGVVTIMTLLVVASGVAGRFVYPSVSGPEHPTARRAVAGWHLVHVPLLVHAAAAAYFGVGIR